MTPEDVNAHEALFEEYGFLLITAEIPLPTVFAAVRMAKSKGITVSSRTWLLFQGSPFPTRYPTHARFYQAE